MRIIKRYANRRMYDYATRNLITLEDLLEIAEREEEVKVIDDRTGEDITVRMLSKALALKNKDEENEEIAKNLMDLIKGKKKSYKRACNEVISTLFGAFGMMKEDIEKLFSMIENGKININSDEYKSIKKSTLQIINIVNEIEEEVTEKIREYFSWFGGREYGR